MLEIIATILSIIGAIFVAVRQRVGFLIWIVSNLLWITFALEKEHYWMGTLFLVYLITSIIGWYYWKKEGRYLSIEEVQSEKNNGQVGVK